MLHLYRDGAIIILKTIQIILEGCKRNESYSQEQLYRQFYPGLFSLCKQFFDDQHDILTALNNGMLNVYKNIQQYDADKGELFTWAYNITRNAALTHLRNKNNQKDTVELTTVTEFKQRESPFKHLEGKDIYFYLAKLPPSTRAICALYYVEGLLIKEISEQMLISEGTVKWHLSESRSKLKIIFTTNAFSSGE